MPTFLFSGGYTHDSPEGIHVFDASQPGATLNRLATVDHVEHPSFLCLHPDGGVLYAVSETSAFDGEPGGGLVAFRFDPTDGSLEEIDRTSSHGVAPCHVAVDPDGRHLHVANYVSGSVAAYALTPDGRFDATVAVHQHEGDGPTERQEGPHAHCAQPTADGRRVYAVDLGTDQIIRYELADAAPTFTRAGHTDVPAGTGPRHIALHPERPRAAAIGELDNTVTLFEIADDGSLRDLATASTRPPDATVFAWAAAIRFSPDGRHLHATSRGDDTIAVFALGDDDSLRTVGHVATGGRTPRDMTFHPGGTAAYVANQDSDRITTFALDDGDPRPRRLDHDVDVPSPTCVVTLEVTS